MKSKILEKLYGIKDRIKKFLFGKKEEPKKEEPKKEEKPSVVADE